MRANDDGVGEASVDQGVNEVDQVTKVGLLPFRLREEDLDILGDLGVVPAGVQACIQDRAGIKVAGIDGREVGVDQQKVAEPSSEIIPLGRMSRTEAWREQINPRIAGYARTLGRSKERGDAIPLKRALKQKQITASRHGWVVTSIDLRRVAKP